MKRKSALFAIIIMLAVTLVNCSSRKKESAEKYKPIARDVISTYITMHPLVSSELGLTSADSSLFTFSAVEIEKASNKLVELRKKIESIPLTNFSINEKENIDLAMLWIKGEIFAIKELQVCTYNPLIYCSEIDEALFQILYRPKKPYRSEAELYIKRVSKIPALISSARANLDKPSEVDLELAMESIDGTISRMEKITDIFRGRYGKAPPDTLQSIIDSIRAFRGFLFKRINSEPKSRNIIGIENLSRTLLYDEYITADQNALINDAERLIDILHARKGSLLRSIKLRDKFLNEKRNKERGKIDVIKNATSKKGADELKMKLEEFSASQGNGKDLLKLYKTIDKLSTPSGFKSNRIPVKAYPSNTPWRYCPPGKNPILSLSDKRHVGICPFVSGCSSQGRTELVIAYSTMPTSISNEEVTFELLKGSHRIFEPEFSICQSRDMVRTILQSSTYRYGWYYEEMNRIIEKFPLKKEELSIKLIDEKVMELSMMIVSLQLNSGTMTLNEAKDKLVKLTGMTRKEASRNAKIASCYPSSSLRGISIVLLDKLYKTISMGIDIKSPRKALHKTLLKYKGLPLMMIIKEVGE